MTDDAISFGYTKGKFFHKYIEHFYKEYSNAELPDALPDANDDRVLQRVLDDNSLTDANNFIMTEDVKKILYSIMEQQLSHFYRFASEERLRIFAPEFKIFIDGERYLIVDAICLNRYENNTMHLDLYEWKTAAYSNDSYLDKIRSQGAYQARNYKKILVNNLSLLNGPHSIPIKIEKVNVVIFSPDDYHCFPVDEYESQITETSEVRSRGDSE